MHEKRVKVTMLEQTVRVQCQCFLDLVLLAALSLLEEDLLIEFSPLPLMLPGAPELKVAAVLAQESPTKRLLFSGESSQPEVVALLTPPPLRGLTFLRMLGPLGAPCDNGGGGGSVVLWCFVNVLVMGNAALSVDCLAPGVQSSSGKS